jgi:hypothetical protein
MKPLSPDFSTGPALTRVLTARGIGSKELHERLDLSWPYACNILAGRMRLSLPLLDQVCHEFNLSWPEYKALVTAVLHDTQGLREMIIQLAQFDVFGDSHTERLINLCYD